MCIRTIFLTFWTVYFIQNPCNVQKKIVENNIKTLCSIFSYSFERQKNPRRNIEDGIQNSCCALFLERNKFALSDALFGICACNIICGRTSYLWAVVKFKTIYAECLETHKSRSVPRNYLLKFVNTTAELLSINS